MKLKSDSEVETAIQEAFSTTGFAAAAGVSTTSDVKHCCAGVAAMYGDMESIPIATLIALAMQLLPIIFGDGGFSLEKLQAILELIKGIFE